MLGNALWFLRRQLNSNLLINSNAHFIVYPFALFPEADAVRCRHTRGQIRVASQCVRRRNREGRPREGCCNTRGQVRVASSTLLLAIVSKIGLRRIVPVLVGWPSGDSTWPGLVETNSSMDSISGFLYTLLRQVFFLYFTVLPQGWVSFGASGLRPPFLVRSTQVLTCCYSFFAVSS